LGTSFGLTCIRFTSIPFAVASPTPSSSPSTVNDFGIPPSLAAGNGLKSGPNGPKTFQVVGQLQSMTALSLRAVTTLIQPSVSSGNTGISTSAASPETAANLNYSSARGI